MEWIAMQCLKINLNNICCYYINSNVCVFYYYCCSFVFITVMLCMWTVEWPGCKFIVLCVSWFFLFVLLLWAASIVEPMAFLVACHIWQINMLACLILKIRPNVCRHWKNLCKLGLWPKFGLRTKSDLFYQVTH